ncbi:MAG: hypothetical protein WDO17_19760 [Alphaproteobacteria bacterium]
MADEVEIEDDLDVPEVADSVVQSKKPEVIEIVFDKLLGTDTWPPPRRMIVNSDSLIEAIHLRNSRNEGKKGKKLGTKNPANFLKDFIRKDTCNKNWPKRLRDLGVTARQVYGDEQVFEFIQFDPSQELPFPNRFDPAVDLVVLPFEALSIPVEARKLGRADEPWLIQVAVAQRLIETHLAIEAAKSGLVVDTLAHLQVSVKTQPEIDATFIASIKDAEGNRLRAYVTVEAKQIGERILEHQIREQIKIAFALTNSLSGEDAIDAVLPIVLKVVRKTGSTDPAEAKHQYIYIAQFEMVSRTDFVAAYASALHDLPLKIQSSALYQPYPPIEGISSKPRRAKGIRSLKKPKSKGRRSKSSPGGE